MYLIKVHRNSLQIEFFLYYFYCICRFLGAADQSNVDHHQQEKTTPANIHQMAFPFDLLSLLPKSQQAEILFSTYILCMLSLS